MKILRTTSGAAERLEFLGIRRVRGGYGELFNSATGPWFQGLRGHISNGDAAALTKAQQAIQKTIDEAR
ncbi:hypothetical protein [Nonomuraea diastatica]|uniref:Uncharacterized protein n=1 Tax=Nonomuraea diastatica TaxID=1848329 RepID=A0A4R4WZF7_9ACTN|nr:hypothetical protein [Nonomuraea diastatica]TDD23256.1 hypothetical protein E1294_09475 [Nonomuraea diastatica]